MADHEDYLPGETPSPHKTTHQNGGADEISVAGLSGETAELAAHRVIANVHHDKYTAAEARFAINNIFGADGKADSDIHFDGYNLTFLADPLLTHHADTKSARDSAIATHAALPTVHQDAPDLILTHKGDASAHHAKYTDAEARVVHSPLSIPPCLFMPRYDTYDFDLDEYKLNNRATLTLQYFYAPVCLPPGCTVTKLTLYGYRDDAASTLTVHFMRTDRVTTRVLMATVTSTWTDGNNNGYDDSIASALIDNANYQYCLRLTMDPNDSPTDIKFTGAKIEFTG